MPGAGALAECRKPATLDIRNPAPFEQAAKANIFASQYPAALEAQTTAIERGGDQPAQFMKRAAILSQLHEPQEATAAFREADHPRAGG